MELLDYAMTREEVARELGISRSRVEQIEKNALKKIGRRMQRYVAPNGTKPAAVLNPKPSQSVAPSYEAWEDRYDRLYRESRRRKTPEDGIGFEIRKAASFGER